MSKTVTRQKGTAAGARAIEALFNPRSVVIVGASADMRKWGGMAAEQVKRDDGLREVYFVNARGGDILGEVSYPDYPALPVAPELAVVTVPQRVFEETIDQILEKGTRSIVAITAGFGEEGAAGQAIQDRVTAKVRAAGAVMMGPNCMGVFDGHAPFRCMPWAELSAGNVGLISQSGGHIMDIGDQLASAGRGLSRVASVGNEADLAIIDVLRNFAAHDPTEILIIYSEDFSEPDIFFRAVEETITAGKEVILLTPGAGSAARRAARSHTGSQMGSLENIKKEAARAGARHASTPRMAVNTAIALLSPHRTSGRRVGIITDTGGPGVICAGLCEAHGLEAPAFSDALQGRLSERLSPRATLNNPVDLVDNLDVDAVAECLEKVLPSPEVDAVLLNVHAFVHSTPEDEIKAAGQMLDSIRRYGKPTVLTTRAMTSPGVLALIKAGLPVYRDMDAAVMSLAALCKPVLEAAP